jgi:hypothetical protein
LKIMHLAAGDPIPPPDTPTFGYVRRLRTEGSRLLADQARVTVDVISGTIADECADVGDRQGVSGSCKNEKNTK